MRITSPTGLYGSILPTGPNDPGNVTFVISNNTPPRSGNVFVKLPPSEEFKAQPDRIYTKFEKRSFLGNLLFDITYSGPSNVGSGSQQREIGEVLEFEEADSDDADPYELQSIVLQQNTSVPNFEVAGISQEEYQQIVKASEERIEQITFQIGDVSTSLKNNKSKLEFNQSSINQSKKLYDNTIAVLGEESSIAIKIKNNLNKLNEDKNELLEERSNLQSSLDSLRTELQKVREAVR